MNSIRIIVLHGFVCTCRYMENGDVTKTSSFLPALPFITAEDAGSLELLGDRVTNLGTNL